MSGLREKHKVLIIDDEANVSDTLALIFAKEGYETQVAYSAEGAIDIIAKWAPDLAIVDVMLPGMNGIDFAVVLKANYPECRLLLFSGDQATAGLLTRSADRGNIFDIVAKPVHPAYMLEAAAGLLAEKPKRLMDN
jgi:CheY-like chemotaxis protein